jgi:O-acetyl-ADP-ribose deacetylase (regulator of RNase III)
VNRLIKENVLPSGQTLQLVQGDVTAEATDAIVNAANRYLKHGAGVAGAVVQRGGPAIQRESDAWVQAHGPVSHSDPAWTSGGNLAAKFVIHAVGPVWGEGEEEQKLGAAVTGSLRVTDELGLATVALPAISTGIFGFPRELAAQVILNAVRDYLADNPSGLKVIKLVIFDEPAVDVFEKAWDDHFSP